MQLGDYSLTEAVTVRCARGSQASICTCFVSYSAPVCRPRLRPAVRAAAPPALLAGLLWSAGNALAIVATQVRGCKP